MDNPKEGISSFFSQVTTKRKNNKVNDTVYAYMFICANDFGWTQQDFEETEIPYLFAVLDKRLESFKEQERQAKKRR